MKSLLVREEDPITLLDEYGSIHVLGDVFSIRRSFQKLKSKHDCSQSVPSWLCAKLRYPIVVTGARCYQLGRSQAALAKTQKTPLVVLSLDARRRTCTGPVILTRTSRSSERFPTIEHASCARSVSRHGLRLISRSCTEQVPTSSRFLNFRQREYL